MTLLVKVSSLKTKWEEEKKLPKKIARQQNSKSSISASLDILAGVKLLDYNNKKHNRELMKSLRMI
ncbi:hypothetical protein HYD45_00880 [Mycoplasmopsis bovis]|nr:hypothetical protein [Mycoplasmopsis bovis]QQH78373.1 hypothetical protein HYD45_00880 [Mycoplasmopsis bovis]